MPKRKNKSKSVLEAAREHLGERARCGELCITAEDLHYLVRGEIWREAGMGPWESGYLHLKCLEARLGRQLTHADFLMRCVGIERNGDVKVCASRDYLQSREFLLHGGR